MQRMTALWNRGLFGKVIIGSVSLLVACCVLGVIGRLAQQKQAAAPAAQVGTAAPAADKERTDSSAMQPSVLSLPQPMLP